MPKHSNRVILLPNTNMKVLDKVQRFLNPSQVYFHILPKNTQKTLKKDEIS
jgi:hypothetical protein